MPRRLLVVLSCVYDRVFLHVCECVRASVCASVGGSVSVRVREGLCVVCESVFSCAWVICGSVCGGRLVCVRHAFSRGCARGL